MYSVIQKSKSTYKAKEDYNGQSTYASKKNMKPIFCSPLLTNVKLVRRKTSSNKL